MPFSDSKALECFETILKDSKSNIDDRKRALINKSQTLNTLTKFEEAKIFFIEAIKISETAHDYVSFAGSINQNTKESLHLSYALTYLQKALEIDSNLISIYFHIALIYKKRKEFPKALTEFVKIIESKDNENRVISLYYISKIYLKLGNIKQASEYFERFKLENLHN